jgi:hydrogenase expression/formation protein HypC
MCLAVPAQIVERRDDLAVADLHGNRVQINTMLTPEAEVGDWILMHAGFAIQRLDADSAEQTWSVLEDLEQSARLAAGEANESS